MSFLNKYNLNCLFQAPVLSHTSFVFGSGTPFMLISIKI